MELISQALNIHILKKDAKLHEIKTGNYIILSLVFTNSFPSPHHWYDDAGINSKQTSGIHEHDSTWKPTELWVTVVSY